jgi:hypothetical protein
LGLKYGTLSSAARARGTPSPYSYLFQGGTRSREWSSQKARLARPDTALTAFVTFHINFMNRLGGIEAAEAILANHQCINDPQTELSLPLLAPRSLSFHVFRSFEEYVTCFYLQYLPWSLPIITLCRTEVGGRVSCCGLGKRPRLVNTTSLREAWLPDGHGLTPGHLRGVHYRTDRPLSGWS